MEYTSAYKLAEDIKASEEYRTYHTLKETVMSDETVAALYREYRKLQMTIQVNVLSGRQADPEDTQRFAAITSLLFSKPEVSQFLLSELQLNQAMSDILRIVTEAAGIELNLPGV